MMICNYINPAYNRFKNINIYNINPTILESFGSMYYHKHLRFYILQINKQVWHLNEKLHVHDPEDNELFRTLVNKIIKHIKIFRNRLFPKLYFKDKPKTKYIEFIFNNPFPYDSLLSGIDLLKIYFNESATRKLSAEVLLSKKDNQLTIDPNNIVFKQNHNHISVLSLIIEAPVYSNEEFEDELIPVIHHELSHAMDILYGNIRIINKAFSINQIILNNYNILKNYRINPENILENNQISNDSEFLWVLNELLYYTLETEVNAYVDSTFNDLKYNKETGYNISSVSPHYYHYMLLYKLTDILKNNLDYFIKQYNEIITKLLNDLKKIQLDENISGKEIPDFIKNKTYNFKDLINYWRKQLLNYNKRCKSLYRNFNINQYNDLQKLNNHWW